MWGPDLGDALTEKATPDERRRAIRELRNLAFWVGIVPAGLLILYHGLAWAFGLA